MQQRDKRATELLLDLEQEMRALGIWEQVPPPAQALSSVQPFCVDTLRFTQWLQWIFIPRAVAVVRRHEPLPHACDIAPLAEAVFEDMQEDTAGLLKIIRRLDRTLSA